MTTRSFLLIANVIGVFVLTGLAAKQWLRERNLREEYQQRTTELEDTRGKLQEAENRAALLEADVSQLKEAVESSAKARAEAEKTLAQWTAERDAQTVVLTEQAATATNDAKTKIEEWSKAIAERDARIGKLQTDLSATRKRLDEAIARLKEAGAR